MDNFGSQSRHENGAKDMAGHIDSLDKAVFLIRKTEKLTSAIYRVTDLVIDEEPIKWRIRNASLDLLIEMVSFTKKEVGNVLYKTSLIDRVISLLEVSSSGSYVSKMNFSILKSEYIKLKHSLYEFAGDSKFIETERSLEITSEDIGGFKEEHKLIEEDIKTLKDSYKGHQPIKERQPFYPSKTKYERVVEKAVPAQRDMEDRNKRRKLITDYIKNQGEVNIRDILRIPSISGSVSSKTIQRELVEMVNSGVLKKQGERRWSRYSISRDS